MCACHDDMMQQECLTHALRDTPTISPGPGTHLTVAFCIPVLGNISVST